MKSKKAASPIEGLALVCEYGVDVVRGLLLGFYPAMAPIGLFRGWGPFFFPPLGLIFILLVAARPPAGFAAPLRLWLGLVALLFAALAPSTFMGAHYQRHLMWAFPTLHVLIAVGLGRMARGAERASPGLDRAAFAAAGALFLGLGLLSTLRFAAAYGSAAGDVYHRDVALAEWMQRHLPPGVTVASVATSVEYLTGHRNLNLHGVTSPAFFGARASEREAAAFETLGRLPAGERPSLLITSDSVQQALPTMPYLVEGPPLFRTASSSPDELLVHTMRYDFPGKNGGLFLPETLAAVAGRQEVDRLNVCDPADERAHDYDFRARRGHLLLHGTARIDAYELPQGREPLVVIDGGRAILGEERFRIRARPGHELLVVLRTAPEIGAGVMRASGSGVYPVGFAEADLALRIDGQDAGRAAFRPRRGWHEQVLRVPETLVRSERPEVTVSGRYASFYYWFFQ